jgi:gamma-glutamyltranspeptidase/glutathione hydrolase
MSNINPDLHDPARNRGHVRVVTSTHWIATAVGMATWKRAATPLTPVLRTAFTLQVVEPHLNGPAATCRSSCTTPSAAAPR